MQRCAESEVDLSILEFASGFSPASCRLLSNPHAPTRRTASFPGFLAMLTFRRHERMKPAARASAIQRKIEDSVSYPSWSSLRLRAFVSDFF